MADNRIPVAVLVSGGGTNLQALMDAAERGELPHASLRLVVSNNPDAYALQRAQKGAIETAVLSGTRYRDQQAFEQAYVGNATAEAPAEEADLMPTATTIQYRNELYRDEQRTAVEEKKSHGLTAKGKLLMAVYAVVVVIIMALIIVNTSVLKKAGNEIAAQEARLNEVAAQSQSLQDEIDYLTDPDTIIERAAELGMTRSA